MSIVYLSLGSNLNDRLSNIQQATSQLVAYQDIKLLATSTFYETEPWGNVAKNWFVNAAIKIETKLKPIEFLRVCQNIEAIIGRNRKEEIRWGEREIDIDILFYDDVVFENEILTIPHKHIQDRAFVLVPMLEIAPDFVHPIYKKTIAQMYDALENPEGVFLYGTIIGNDNVTKS